MKLYLLILGQNVEPEIQGGFKDEHARIRAAKRYRQEEGKNERLCKLDIEKNGVPSISAFKIDELDDDDFVAFFKCECSAEWSADAITSSSISKCPRCGKKNESSHSIRL